MDADSVLVITPSLAIRRSELTYRATRAGGPGGQHVNKTATRIELTWVPAASPSLSETQRARLLEKLAPRLDGEGTLRLVSSEYRSQTQNREAVTARFQRLIADALKVRKVRRPTAVPRAERERRLREKQKRSEVKRDRRRIRPDD